MLGFLKTIDDKIKSLSNGIVKSMLRSNCMVGGWTHARLIYTDGSQHDPSDDISKCFTFGVRLF